MTLETWQEEQALREIKEIEKRVRDIDMRVKIIEELCFEILYEVRPKYSSPVAFGITPL